MLVRGLAAIVLVVGAAVLIACNDDGGASVTPSSGASATPAATGTAAGGKLTVFATASLTDAFTKIGDAFEAANEGADVEFNFAGSPALRTQLEQGARADILATADQSNMQAALESSLVVDAGKTFVRNRLAIIVPKANPAEITKPEDLGKAGVKLVLAQKEVPVGSYARQAIQKMEDSGEFSPTFLEAVLANVVSEEPNVKAVVTKVQLGEADAGIVYASDVTTSIAGDVTLVEIPDAYNIIAAYPIAVTKDARNAALALEFIGFVLSPAGQAILEEAGFIPVE